MVDLARLPNPSTRALTRELAALRTDVDALQRGLRATQLQNASIESGTLIVRDGDGTIRQTIGMQPDGTVATVAVNAPQPPPPPTPATVTPTAAGLMIGWDGKFVGARPADFNFTAAHIGTSPGFSRSVATLVGTMPEAGQLPAGPLDTSTTYFVVLVAVNSSGMESPGSDPVSGKPNMVVAQDLLDGIVKTSKLADQAATQAKLAAASVGTAQMGNQVVTLAQLAGGSVDATKLVDSSVGPAAIAPLAVTGPAIAASAVTAGKVAANTLTAAQIAANTITAGQVAADTLTANEIAASAIGAGELAANSVIAGKLAADSVSTTNIIAGAVQAADIAAGAVTAGAIAAGAVTAGTIAAGAVTAGTIAANAITAGNIQAGSITADRLAATLVLASTLIAGTAGGARVQLNGSGIQAFRSDGTTKTLDFNGTTGDMLIAGQYRSSDSGSRIVINTSGTQDFYNGSTRTARIQNASTGIVIDGETTGSRGLMYVSNDSSSVTYGAIGSTQPGSFRVDNAGTQQWGRLVGMRYEQRYGGDGTTPRVFIAATNSSGGDIGTSVIHFLQRTGSGASPLIQGAGHNASLSFYGGEVIAVHNDDPYTYAAFVGSNISSASSVAGKEQVGEIAHEDGRTSWDVIEGAPALAWYYTSESTGRGDKPRHPDGSPIMLREIGDDGTESWVEMEWEYEPKPRRQHRFPLAEDIEAIDPQMVGPGAHGHEDDRVVDLRDMIGTLWDAVDRLIKRNRLLEQRLAVRLPALAMPQRPQRGDLAEGIGALIAGRTRRRIDATTGMPTGLLAIARPRSLQQA